MEQRDNRLPRLANVRCSVAYETRNGLGEGAFWDRAGRRLLWVDILGANVFVGAGEAYETYRLPVMPSVIWKVSGERVYLATDEGVGELDLDNGRYRTVVEVEADQPDTRSNDGGEAPDGSFWFGTMLREPVRKGGALYRVSPNLSVQRVGGPVGIPNTFLFPAGGAYALIGDSFDRRIVRYQLHDSALSGGEPWMAKATGSSGVPDGSALVDETAVINAEWDGGRLVAYNMRGEAYDALNLPVSRPTSCALGGGDGRLLYVTSAREGLTDAELEAQPLAGAVFAVHLNPPNGSE
ncbi:SMP-30/gluconolactonase/LRE family protein [Aquisalimonas lutea]|uniref:SMP-30/gluconolactonase/LRE family protein n=1 Tax=Aquisalimonas lutea TaxID=1327750 RepID=UPI0025B28658|nr:SMP-30/gluconolactonase/LRE family protein [Aquisalimonas lutea]MDN3517816.1 SMP-30/gluconolactonase/LRE family protein [Aquisalimonas lutea]